MRKVAPARADGFTQAAGFLRQRTTLLICALVLGLSLATVYDQYRDLIPISAGGNPRAFIEIQSVNKLERVTHGGIGDPWQYRIGSAWVALWSRDLAKAVGVDQPGMVGLLGFRLLQNIAIFWLAWLFYRRLGATRYGAALGLTLVAWAFTQAHFHSGLSWDTYTDVLAYLVAALLILSRRYAWVLPLTVLAALNRETSGLIPVMLMASAVPLGLRTRAGKRVLQLGVGALALYGATLLIVRKAMGPADLIIPFGQHPGWEVWRYNVGRGQTWDNFFRMVTVVPLLAIAQWRHWPQALRVIGLAVAPAWMILVPILAVVDETRLFLVPYVLVFVPGAVVGLRSAAVKAAPAS